MKTSKKKMAAGAAIATAAVLTLAACGGSDSGSTSPTSAPSATSSAAPSADATTEPTSPASAEPSTSATPDAAQTGTAEIPAGQPGGPESVSITAEKGLYFEVLYPEGYFAILPDYEWNPANVDYVEEFDPQYVVGPAQDVNDVTPAKISKLDVDYSKSSVSLWQAGDRAGTSTITLSYTDPKTGETFTAETVVTVK